MRFDIIIANPPYSIGKSSTQLHLQVMQSVLQFAPLSPQATIVSVQPLSWLLSPTHRWYNSGSYRRFADLRERIADIEVIRRTETNKIFGIAIHSHVGIYTFAVGRKCSFDWSCFLREHGRFDDDFYSRVIAPCRERRKPCLSDVLVPAEQATEHHCVIPAVQLGFGTPKQFWLFSRNKKIIRGEGHAVRCKVVNFETDEEAENFRNSCYTVFYEYISWCYKVSSWLQLINYPWLGDAVNPRTKIVGYKGEWTDDDLWEYFGFTQEEKEKARSTMKNIDYSKL